MSKPTPAQIEAAKKLGLTDEEIFDMYADDDDVDHGIEMPWDLSAEEHKKAMKNANADEHKKLKNAVKRERKPNPTKAEIISALAQFLEEEAPFLPESVVVANKERMICFEYAGEKFDLTLIQKRKPKT